MQAGGGRAGGNILDLVAIMDGCSVREAALRRNLIKWRQKRYGVSSPIFCWEASFDGAAGARSLRGGCNGDRRDHESNHHRRRVHHI
jgi:hypothetical protein